MAGLGATPGAVQCVVQEDKQHADHLVALRGVEVIRIGEQPETANEVGRGAGVGDVDGVAQRNPVARLRRRCRTAGWLASPDRSR
jgi:hypothetical protein